MADPARARKIADRIQELIAANLQQIVKDPDLGFVTITDVRVTGDLQNASVFYTVFGDAAQRERSAQVLEANRGKLRSFVGKQLGIRLTPTLEILPDGVPENASHIDDLLRSARERDEDLARSRSGAEPAGEADPYRTKDDEGEPLPPSPEA
ncbi:ribosome-binding factor A [Janibacter sp. Soil728]|uniref:30S ribosome-binding factor RbfA n=1 Tax=Janibacter sp. Soil728 TaxID=1736393 RepID=UPI000700CAD2|nr:30S ribosome-binding factor RbfA [Janibacter sp. Soil728]KRE38406.1 ribosome-binding factor A [Janibacter sp. Soil728]